jgi:hypothetical protein
MRAGAVQGLLQAGEQLVAGAGQGDVQVRGDLPGVADQQDRRPPPPWLAPGAPRQHYPARTPAAA